MEPLRDFVAGLDAELAVTVLVVLHIPARSPSVLPAILGRVTALEVRHPVDGEPLPPGVVLVAPPDRHLELEGTRVRLGTGPRHNGHRPSADRLLESLAHLGSHAAGVVLSGTMDDGAAGLWSVRQAGGLTLVQDPAESLFSGMPEAAISLARPEVVAGVAELAERIGTWAARLSAPARPSEVDPVPVDSDPEPDQVTPFTCPDCGGTLSLEEREGIERFRCRVGHAYSAAALAVGKDEALEKALWAAVVALEERADLDDRVARRLGSFSAARSARVGADADVARGRAEMLRRMIGDLVARVGVDYDGA